MINENETVILKYYDAARHRVFTFDGSLTGDANGDGTVDVADVVAIVNQILGQPDDSFVIEAADMDGDGKVDVADVVATVNVILGN
jgi:hypothetical protein